MSPIIIFVVLSFQQSAIHYFIAYNNELRVPPPIKQGIAITIAAPIAPANTLEFEFAFFALGAVTGTDAGAGATAATFTALTSYTTIPDVGL